MANGGPHGGEKKEEAGAGYDEGSGRGGRGGHSAERPFTTGNQAPCILLSLEGVVLNDPFTLDIHTRHQICIISSVLFEPPRNSRVPG